MNDKTGCPDGVGAAIQARADGAFRGRVNSSSADELAASRRRLLGMAVNWGLSDLEVGRLLGHRGCWRCGALSSDAEARMRMLLDIEPLEDFLGGAKPWIDLFMKQGAGYPIKANGEHKFKFKGNWKIQLENTTDLYHFPVVHKSWMKSIDDETAAAITSFMTSDDAFCRSLGNGHSLAVLMPELVDLDALGGVVTAQLGDVGGAVVDAFLEVGDLLVEVGDRQVERLDLVGEGVDLVLEALHALLLRADLDGGRVFGVARALQLVVQRIGACGRGDGDREGAGNGDDCGDRAGSAGAQRPAGGGQGGGHGRD